MKIRAIPLVAALFLVCCATQAHAAKFPPGLGGACATITDSTVVNIYNIQFGLGACRPGAACVFPSSVGCDSVSGVTGIITGIKNNGTSRTFYMQSRRTDLSYTGIDVFNGNGLFNTNIQVGDSVSVYGKVEEGFAKAGLAESGETEITGLDGSSTTVNDLVTNRLSTGNPLPAFHTLSVADIRFPSVPWNSNTPNASFASGEPWESALVKVIGPLVVGMRVYDLAPLDTAGTHETYPTYPGCETRSPSGGGFFCYPQGSPGDSIYVDMTSFVTLTPPQVGTVIDSVFGILQQTGTGRAGAAGVVSWRIAVRSAAPGYTNDFTPDLYLRTPPGISEVYPIANDSVKIVFDQAVTSASATIAAHYSCTTSERAVDFVHMLGAHTVICHVPNTWPIGGADVMSANLMTGLNNGLTQTSPQAEGFINGVLGIPLIQAADPDSLPTLDRSKYAGVGTTDGTRLTFTGVVTGRYFTREYYVQDVAGGTRSGIKVFQPSSVSNGNGGTIPNAMTVGRKYLISGRVTEFFGETEVNAPGFVLDQGASAAPPLFTGTIANLADFTPGAAGKGEDYEGCLVKFSHNLRTTADAGPANPGGFFHVINAAGGPDTIEVDCTAAPGYNPNPDEIITVQGPYSYRFGAGDLFPRNNADVAFPFPVGVGNDVPTVVSFSAHPNPARVTELDFALPRRDEVELSVFDLRGRRVATIARGSFPAGRHSRTWDGRTDKGSLLGSGVFFYRLKVGTEVFNVRGVRIN